MGPASLGGLESEYDVRRRQSLGFVVAAIPCRHHPCFRLSLSYCHTAFRAPVIGRIPPSRHSYRPCTTRSTVTAPTSNPRFSPPALARLPFSTYPVLFLTRRAFRRRVSSYPRTPRGSFRRLPLPSLLAQSFHSRPVNRHFCQVLVGGCAAARCCRAGCTSVSARENYVITSAHEPSV